MDSQGAAAIGIGMLEQQFLVNPPAGIPVSAVTSFFNRLRPNLTDALATLINTLLGVEPNSQVLDRQYRGSWHLMTKETLRQELEQAKTIGKTRLDWLVTRLAVHRRDLLKVAESWLSAQHLKMTDLVPVPQPIPADDGGTLLVYELTATDMPAGIHTLSRDQFARFAELAYFNDDTSGNILLDIAAGWFGRPGIPAAEPDEDLDVRRLLSLEGFLRANDPRIKDREQVARAALSVRRRLLRFAGLPIPTTDAPELRFEEQVIDPADAPTPAEILVALEATDDLSSARARTEANVTAIASVQDAGLERHKKFTNLMRYSGWGGLSIDSVRSELPARWTPDSSALIHEYYTPTIIALEIARVIRPWTLAMPRSEDGFVMALEPAAGIGRLVNAASTPGFEQLKWSVIEYSEVSASLLQAMRPDLRVVKSSFEEWISLFETSVSGKLGLVLANPPYGARGGTYVIDKNKEYRESRAYVYFLRRCLDLLAEGGVGVFLVPYGFLTGKGSAFTSLRDTVLKRHHLRAAFRLPTDTFPGTSLVTDLLFWESRGGDLPTVLTEDLFILEGNYYEREPSHILGIEVGAAGDEDDTTAKSRWGYEVKGNFSELPPFEPRLRCESCQVTTRKLPPKNVAARRRKMEELAPHVQAAILLGDRTKRYLDLIAAGDHAKLGRAAALQPDLFEALTAWAENLGQPRIPWGDRQLQAESANHPELASFLAAFTESGALVPQIGNKPAWQPHYEGANDDVGQQADWLYSIKRELTVESLTDFRRSLGIFSIEPLHSQLTSAGWCFDDGKWLPERDYYSGLLWDRWERARLLAKDGDTQAAVQLARLTPLIKSSRIDEIDAEPRMPWVPIGVLSQWLERWTGQPVANLEWRESLLQVASASYQELPEALNKSQLVAIGYVNHDLAYFQPAYTKQVDSSTGEEENAESALDRVRLEYSLKAKRDFRDYVTADPELSATVEVAYNRLFRGYIIPEYSSEPIKIERWAGRIKLKAHQARGARRLLAANGGLLGFDVGVGKTYTGIATIARLREEGRARRPIVVVPNTIIWKWFRDIKSALPDYRILVVGANRYVGRGGTYVSKIDTPEERALKWRQFQAGQYDVALVTYSVFGRTQVRSETFRDWAYETPVVLRKLGLDSRELAKKIDSGEDSEARKPRVSERALIKLVGEDRFNLLTLRQKEELTEKVATEKAEERKAEIEKLLAVVAAYDTLSERERAIFGEALDRWVATRLESTFTPDPGIFFEDLGCDCLMVDEAQNYKNLWPVAAREGGIPKYLGAISEGSDRAWAFAVRAHITRRHTSGSGVYLLSATPAKNSPLEYFTLLGYIDSGAWAKLGITDPEVFIDRYLRLESRQIISPDLKITTRSVVAGFRNLEELRSVIFRFAEFRTAEEVGLVLPKRDVTQIFIPMNEAQDRRYEDLSQRYAAALKRSARDPRAKMQALGLMQRMAMVAIHPQLDQGVDDGWTFRNAHRVDNFHCPKLDKIVEMVMVKPDCGHLVFCDFVAVHMWLKMALVEAGYPVKRIAIFNADQAKDPVKRQAIADGFNGTPAIVGEDGVIEQDGIEPDYDIVIANATAYEGIDLHIRTCEVYHVDLPWEPATLQQRNGRAVRQGNTQSVIGIRYLLAERSLDVIRLNMILGKLGWMKDLLLSAERETNNPAAQAEMSAEEMVLFLARDPAEAKVALEEQRKLLVLEQQARVRENAWNWLRGFISRHNTLGRLSEAQDQEAVRREADALAEKLNLVPATVWPWHFVIELVRRGTPLILAGGLALPGDQYVMAEKMGLAIGQFSHDAVGIRLYGSHKFERVRIDRLDQEESRATSPFETELARTIAVLDADAVQKGAERWDSVEDEFRFAPGLLAAIERVEAGDWFELGIAGAGRTWRQYLVAKHWLAISAAVRRAPFLPFKIPVRAGKDGLKLFGATEEYADELMTVDLDSWSDFILRAQASDEKWSDLNDTALAWWGKPFPRAILRKHDELAEISVTTPDGEVRVRPLVRKGPLAVTYMFGKGPDNAEGTRYTVTHIPSGLAVVSGFKLEEVAQAALAFILKQKVDWEQKAPSNAGLQPGFMKTLHHLIAENRPLALAQLERYSQENA